MWGAGGRRKDEAAGGGDRSREQEARARAWSGREHKEMKSVARAHCSYAAVRTSNTARTCVISAVCALPRRYMFADNVASLLNKNPAKDFCWWDLDGVVVVVVVVVVVCAVVDGSLDLLARSTCFFI